MTTIADLDKRERERLADLEKLRAARDAAKAEIERVDTEAELAARSGNLDRYNVLTKDKERLKAATYVTSAALEEKSKPSVTMLEAQEAWGHYSGKYEKDFARLLGSLADVKAKYAGIFSEILALEEEAFSQREKLAHMIGIRPTAGEDPCSPSSCYDVFKMSALSTDVRFTNKLMYNAFSGDAAFFAYLMDYDVPSEEASRLTRIIINHRAK